GLYRARRERHAESCWSRLMVRVKFEGKQNLARCVTNDYSWGMTAILDIPEVRERVSRLSVEEYHRLGEFNDNGRRTELIRGIVIEKMSKSPLHRSICSRLYKMLSATLGTGYSVWKEEPLTLSDSEPEPDISVTLGGDEVYKERHPGSAELV